MFQGQVPLLKACPDLVEGGFRGIALGYLKVIGFELDGVYLDKTGQHRGLAPVRC